MLKLPRTEKQNELEQKLKAFTNDSKLLEKADKSVYSPKELVEKLSGGCRDILLVNGSFNIPLSERGGTYTAIGDPTITSVDRAAGRSRTSLKGT